MNDQTIILKKKSLITITIIIVFSIILISLICIAQKPEEEEVTGGIPLETNFYSKISTESTTYINQQLGNTFGESIINHLKILSILYPQIKNITIQQNSFQKDNNIISFTMKSDNKKIFYIEITDTITIKTQDNYTIYTSTIYNNETQISPYLLWDFFPYKNTLSNQGNFTATILDDKKTISVFISSCVTKELENEAIEKTKEYIKNINSDPNFFTYKTTTLCF